MRKPTVCFVTVCGGGEDYEFLLGSIEHHATMGRHFVLDTAPMKDRRVFKGLPSTVAWDYEPIYGHGWKDFQFRTALETAIGMAKRRCPAEAIAVLDCDEFFAPEAASIAFPLARDRMVEVKTLAWKLDGGCYDFGESEWHRRLWPAGMDVRIVRNDAWLAHPDYNGNPEHHPIHVPPEERKTIRAHGSFHHHLHYAIGQKALEIGTALSTIPEWAGGGTPVPPVPWPEPLARWRDLGALPSLAFS